MYCNNATNYLLQQLQQMQCMQQIIGWNCDRNETIIKWLLDLSIWLPNCPSGSQRNENFSGNFMLGEGKVTSQRGGLVPLKESSKEF